MPITFTPLAHRMQRLPWPLPALLAWAAGWLGWLAASAAGLGAAPSFALGLLLGLGLAMGNAGLWRRGIAAAGFPASAVVLGAAAHVPSWLWLLLLLPLLIAYPLRAWRDAPFFPTPPNALDGLAAIVGTRESILDAGCGLGHGLRELHAAWPRARLLGLEWSPLLAWTAALRCRYAQVRRGDMWAASWRGHDLVYVFQRPESMARVWDKASRELAPGAWLVSLEFPVTGMAPHCCLKGGGRRALWVYRMPSPAIEHSTRGSPGR